MSPYKLPSVLCVLVLLAIMSLLPDLASAQSPAILLQGEEASGNEGSTVQFEQLSAEERRDLLARMSDTEVRQLVLDQFDRAVIGNSLPGDALALDDQRLRETLGEMFSSGPAIGAAFANAFEQIRDEQTKTFRGYKILAFIGLVAAGLAIEWLYRRAIRNTWRRIEHATPDRLFAKFSLLALRIVLDLIAIALFFATAYGIYLLIAQEHEPTRLAMLAYLKAIVILRVVAIFARFALAPYAGSIRLFDIDTKDARAIYWWVMVGAAVLTLGSTTRELVAVFGFEPAGYRLLGFVVGGIGIAALIGAVWRGRRSIARLIQGDSPRRSVRGFLAFIWPIAVTAYLVVLFVAGTVQAALTGTSMFSAGVASLVLLAVLPVADAGLCRGLAEFFGRRGRDIRDDLEIALPDYQPVIRTALRAVLIVVAILLLLGLWDIPLIAIAAQSVEGRILGGIVTAAVTILIAYVLWQIVRVTIDRKLMFESGGATGAHGDVTDGEVGGATPVSRISTLLPLIRSFLLVFIVLVAAMVALSALGVDIGPLIAGAGILGIAIGFGAQTLVRDIVSGLFFLWDDAFRVGEYVELGFVKGTVEGISIRSMRLRHHRGPLHTVPYGEIKHLTNHSRDWVIMKLEFQVPHDTDIAMVKKIFKRIGQELQNDPEMGPDLLQPLKSQGVLRMEDSAMVIRAKFMAKPGGQFVIRREVFARVQKAFKEAGIEFARRRVIVDVPKGIPEAEADELREQAAAAVIASEGKDSEKA